MNDEGGSIMPGHSPLQLYWGERTLTELWQKTCVFQKPLLVIVGLCQSKIIMAFWLLQFNILNEIILLSKSRKRVENKSKHLTECSDTN